MKRKEINKRRTYTAKQKKKKFMVRNLRVRTGEEALVLNY